MFQIMPIIYQAEKQKAEANVNFADIEYLNTKNLADATLCLRMNWRWLKQKIG